MSPKHKKNSTKQTPGQTSLSFKPKANLPITNTIQNNINKLDRKIGRLEEKKEILKLIMGGGKEEKE